MTLEALPYFSRSTCKCRKQDFKSSLPKADVIFYQQKIHRVLCEHLISSFSFIISFVYKFFTYPSPKFVIAIFLFACVNICVYGQLSLKKVTIKFLSGNSRCLRGGNDDLIVLK